ncbi:barstar family protein [Paenibacillus mucilaginosus]|uniref:Barstar-like protein, ribonuclease inhibitor n=2 Tax=Paenibacillus mucilaginosus TaxID=61624 RepID=H6NJT6_9BACL|nr:barstar family protein [Paenibacillus mucilaginosus]AEI41732.1 barstar-like protein, ribonuclease (barnase) inhibitor [Paenibacillus mucilaginosus KNP414]AFC30240.1 barstar-like protein, ribonuclease inhibitor [Paenibacillus mucilaginosus 3016]MCG7214423.1 barstar family protein [Paenibacillus mucilaginosus]WDM30707.1 barstar family protein [Paenibacillus mucilaginosus]WFA18884.1 barnase inhibitor [Paenibacillus mucilaginosus]
MRKYAVIEDESGVCIGYCADLIGLAGEQPVEVDGEMINRIVMFGFERNSRIDEGYSVSSSWGSLQLAILDTSERIIGSYHFVLSHPSRFDKVFGREQSRLELLGTLLAPASAEALAVWEGWRESPPVEPGEWIKLSGRERSGWLEVVRLYDGQLMRTRQLQGDQRHQTYEMDASPITDALSFYCALGEAVHGPGGYYGTEPMSLYDCICGGFGVSPPFRIIIRNIREELKREPFFAAAVDRLTSSDVIVVMVPKGG